MNAETLTYSGELVVVRCWCSMNHAVPRELRDYQLRQHNDGHANVIGIFCPLGHSHVPSGTPKARREEEARKRAEAREQHLRDQLEAAERSNSALRGQVTKVKKRAAAGVCPCCQRTFQNVARHMAGQHPGFVAGAK